MKAYRKGSLIFCLCLTVLLVGCGHNPESASDGKKPIILPGQESVITPEQPSSPSQDDTATPAPDIPPETVAAYKAAYTQKVQELLSEWENLTYDLVYFDGDDIPELIAGHTGYWVSMYTFADGELYAVMDQWGYGVSGNGGYDYLPRQNVLRNYNTEFAGAIAYISYNKIGKSHEMESYYEEDLKIKFFEDKNGNGFPDPEEYSEESPTYYYGQKQLSEEEFNNMMIEGDYKNLYGEKTAEEIKEELAP